MAVVVGFHRDVINCQLATAMLVLPAHLLECVIVLYYYYFYFLVILNTPGSKDPRS